MTYLPEIMKNILDNSTRFLYNGNRVNYISKGHVIMKKHIRAISAFLLVALLAGLAAAPASATTIFVNQETASSVGSPCDPCVPAAPAQTGNNAAANPLGGIPVYPRCEVPSYGYGCGYGSFPQFGAPAFTGAFPGAACGTYFPYRMPQPYDIINSGKFFTCANAKDEIAKYLAANTYQVSGLAGDSRSYGSGIYMVSENPRVASFNVKTGKLTANSFGSTKVYVYTLGGSPLACLDVAVRADICGGLNHSDSLTVTADNWNPAINEKVTLTVKSNSGKKYDDIRYRIMLGNPNILLNESTGAVTGYQEGLSVVRAYSKSDDNVYGDIFIFVGSMNAAVYDGYWNTCKGGIQVSKWGYDICDIFTRENLSIKGWIRSTNGLFLPIIGLVNAEVIQKDGTHAIRTILTGGSLVYLDSLRGCYGSRDSLKSAIALYNASRYPNRFTYTTTLTSDESAVLFMAHLLGLIG